MCRARRRSSASRLLSTSDYGLATLSYTFLLLFNVLAAGGFGGIIITGLVQNRQLVTIVGSVLTAVLALKTACGSSAD